MRLSVLAVVLLCASHAGAVVRPQRYALFRLDPLGIEPRIVDQLERILRVEMERALGAPLPSREEVERVAAGNAKLAACTADPACLRPLAHALKATRVVSGNVGGLADSYVINLKLADDEGREIRRVGATLRGSPEELIDEIRVAAYRLVAPESLVGNIAVLSDLPGSTVSLDGAPVGTTPLLGPLAGLSVGIHQLEVRREGFTPFAEQVPVRFEKTTQVVVHQSATTLAAHRAVERAKQKPLYARWYVWAGVIAGAVVTGVIIGYTTPKQGTNCATLGGCR